MLRRQFANGYFFEKTIVHCLIFREDNSPVLRRQLYSAQFMVKITVFREDNQPVLHLQRRQSASASHFEKTILPVLKKTILLEKTILPFPSWTQVEHFLNASKTFFSSKLDFPVIKTFFLTFSECLSAVMITGESNFDEKNVQEMFNWSEVHS